MKNVFEISAIQNKGTGILLESIKSMLPEGPKYYPEDIITDRPTAFMISEIIREKVFELTHEEIPYSSAVEIDQIEEDEKITKVYATIFIERDSQKGIVLGKGGKMIKEIGTLARKDIEYLLDNHVFLSLHVKVKTNWTEDRSELRCRRGIRNLQFRCRRTYLQVRYLCQHCLRFSCRRS